MNSVVYYGIGFLFCVFLPKLSLNGQVLDLNFSETSTLELLENNYYGFRGDENQTIYLSNVFNSDYNGSDVFNNEAKGRLQYLLFSPTNISDRQWFLYDKNDTDKNVTLSITPYHSSIPAYSNDLNTGDEFGYDVSLNDWNESVVGAPGDNSHLGAVYLFQRDLNNSLIQSHKIVPDLAAGESNRTKFGAALSTYENRLIIGAPDASDFRGKVYYYQRDDGNYSMAQELTDSNGSLDEQFGYALVLGNEGEELFVGSPHEKNTGEKGIGKVTQFSFDGTGWVQEMQFWSSDDRNITGDLFGYDLATDDEFLVVGAPDALLDETETGLVYVFQKDDQGAWSGTPDVLSSEFLSDGDQFGHKVEIVDNIIFVGSKNGDDDNRSDVGLVYVFEYENGQWIEKSIITPPNQNSSQIFSHDISARENFLVVGTTGIGNSGLAYVFKKGEDASDWNLISTLENTEVNASEPSLFSIHMGSGEIIIGMPEDNGGQELAGSIQTFTNPAWQRERLQKFPPMFARSSQFEFVLEEDDPNGLVFDFNASHPFDANFSWQLHDFNSDTGVIEFNNTSGELLYLPAQDYNGFFDLELTVSVDEGNITQTLTFQIQPVPDAPTFDETNETLPYAMVGDEYSFEINASDVDGDDLTFSLSPLGTGLSFVGNKIMGTPLQSAIGDANAVEYTLNVEVTDGVLTANKIFFLTIYKANSTPRFKNADGEIMEEISINLDEDFSATDWRNELIGLSLTDDDPSNLWFSLSLDSPPTSGVVLLDPNSSEHEYIQYQSELNFHGTDQFRVRLTDSNIPSKSSFLEVNINILPINDPPVISSSPDLTVIEGNEFRYELDVFDPDLNDTFSYYSIQLPDWLEFNQNDGVIQGTPGWQDYSPTPHFVSIGVLDSVGATGVQEFGITVIPLNYPPVIGLGENVKVVIDEDENPLAWNTFELVVTDPDTNLNLLDWRVQDLPDNGEVFLTQGSPYYFLDYQPDGNFTGSDFFTLELFDTLDLNRKESITFEVVVQSVEDAPVFQPKAKYTDAVIGYQWEYQFLGIDGDDGQVVSVFETSTLPEWLNLEIVQNEGNVSGRLHGVPNFSDFGPREIKLRVEDDIGSGYEQSIIINVIQGNYLPQILGDDNKSFEILEEDVKWEKFNPLTVYEENNQRLTWVLSGEPDHGEVTIDADEDGLIRYLSYQPDGNFSGQDALTLSVSDGIAEDSFTYFFDIPNINDAPLIFTEDIDISMKEGDDYEFDIRFNDGDGIATTSFDIFPQVPSWVSLNMENYDDGAIRVKLNPQEINEGNYSFTFSISDSTSQDQISLDVEVFVLNYSPVLNQESIEMSMEEDIATTWFSSENSSILASIEVVDEETTDQFVWAISTPPSSGEASIGNSITDLIYVPDGNFSGKDVFVVSVTDSGANGEGGKSDFIEIIVNVNQVDDAPVFRSSPFSSSNRESIISWNDESEYFYRVETFDADWSFFGSPVLSLNSTLPSWLSFVEEANASGYLTGLPDVTDEGTYRINFQVGDMNGSIANQDFLLHVIIDDYPPRFESKINNFVLKTVEISINEDENITEWLNPQNFVGINPDREFDDFEKIIWSVYQDSQIGSKLEVSGSGGRPENFQFSPPKDFFGTDQFVLKMNEGDRYGLLKFKINVNGVPDPPQFTSIVEDNLLVEEGTPFEMKLFADDPDGQAIRFQLVSPVWDLDPWIELTQTGENGEVLLVGVPKVSSKGNLYPYKILAIDESGRFDQMSLDFYVEGYNRKPIIAIGEEITLFFNQSGDITNLDLADLSAIDPEGEELIWDIAPDGAPSKGTVEVFGEGSYPSVLKYFPQGIDIESDEFTLRVSDGTKYELIKIIAKMVWGQSNAQINISNEIRILEGEAFFQEITIGSDNAYEQFSHNLNNAPEWLQIKQLSSFRAHLFGEAPVGVVGDYNIEYEVSGERSSTVKESFIINVESGASPFVELKGDPVMRISSAETFVDPGYTIIDPTNSQNGLQVETITPLDYDNLGFKNISYKFVDSNVSESVALRKVKRYEQWPLSANPNPLTLSVSENIGLNWSGGDKVNFWRSGIASAIENQSEDESLINWGRYDSNRSNLSDFQLENVFSGSGLRVLDIVKDDDSSLLVAGTFLGKLLVNDQTIISPHNQTGFLLRMIDGNEMEWVKTFGGDVQISDLKICRMKDGQFNLGGSFDGAFYVEELSLELSTESENKRGIFLLSFDHLGRVIDATQTNENFQDMSLVDIDVLDDCTFITANEVDSISNVTLGKILKFSKDFKLLYTLNLSGSDDLAIKDSCLDSGILFLGGTCKGSLELDEVPLGNNNEKQGFVLGIAIKESTHELEFVRLFNATHGSSVQNLCTDYWGDLYIGLSFEGTISLLEAHTSLGKSDLILAKMKKDNGNFLWSKQIGGTGDEKFYGLESNSVGNLLMGLQSEMGVSLGGEIFLSNNQMQSVCFWSFTSNLGNPVIEAPDIVIEDQQPFFFKLDTIHSSDVYYQIKSIPEWITFLPQEQAMNTAHFFVQPQLITNLSFLNEKPFRIRVFNLEGDFRDVVIGISKSSLKNTAFGELPLREDEFYDPLQGDGEVLSFKEKGGAWAFVINDAQNYAFNEEQLIDPSLSASYVSLIDRGRNWQKTIAIKSSMQVNISDTSLFSNGFHYMCGNFKGDLLVNDQAYFSEGGYDYFILKLSEEGDIIDFRSFGGDNDELAKSVDIWNNQLLIGGDFSLSTKLGSRTYQAKDVSDSFLLSIDCNDFSSMEWAKTFEEDGNQFFSSLSINEQGYIFTCSTSMNNSDDPANKLSGQNLKSHLLLKKINNSGEVISETTFEAEGRLRKGRLIWVPYTEDLILAGEFEKAISRNGRTVTSNGGFDIFIASLKHDFKLLNLASLGGSLNDRLSDLAIESSRSLLLGGVFYEDLIIGTERLLAGGSSDAFFTKFDYLNFGFGEVLHLDSSSEDRIDCIVPKSVNDIYFAGISSIYSGSAKKDLFISRLFSTDSGPRVLGSYPNEIPSSRSFDFTIKTGFWHSESDEFKITHFEEEGAYKWLEVTVDSSANLTFSGISPSANISIPFDFKIVSSTGQECSVNFLLGVTVDKKFPLFVAPQSIEVFQYQNEQVPLKIHNLNLGGVVKLNGPTWVDLSSKQKNDEYILNFSPREGTLGHHELEISAITSNGSIVRKKIRFRIIPNLASENDQTEQSSENGWLSSWFGNYFLTDDAWSYHLSLGWIYFSPSKSGTEVWFWHSSLGWVWTNKSLWQEENGSYLFSANSSDWIYLKEKIYFNFSTNQWLNFDQFL